MLERYNPLLRIVCLALAGLVLYQVSRLAFKRDAIAVSRLEAPLVRLDSTNQAKVDTNAPAAPTNSVAPRTNDAASTSTSTNAPATTNSPVGKPPGPVAMNRRQPGGPGGAPKVNLPPDAQALVDKIKQSQLFGPEMKPPPMALLGIAGKDVFLRGPNGQTGLIREGEELGGA